MYVPERPTVELGDFCNDNVTLGRIRECADTVFTRCAQDLGRSHARCICRPAFASRYDALAFQCEGTQNPIC